VQPDSAPSEPADANLAVPGGMAGTGASTRVQQPSLLVEHLEQLARDEQLTTWRAFAAPLAADSGAVVSDPELVRLAVNILAVYANHQSRSGLTYAQLRDGLRQLGNRFPQAATDARLEHLHRMGFLETYLPKQYQGRYIVRPAGLAGALAAARVTERGGIDELILLLDRTRAALGARHPDPVQVLTHLNSCRHALMVFALDLHRRVATGTSVELIEACRQHDHSSFTRQVVELNDMVTTHFSRYHDLEEAGAALIEAEQFYRSQVRAAIGKVLDQGSAGLNFDVLTPAEYEAAALTAGLEELADVGTALIADTPGVYLDPDALIEAVETYQPRSRPHVRPPEPTGSGDPDPVAAIEAAREAARRYRRLGLEALLAGAREADLTPHMQQSWEAAARILVDALALDADPEEPFVLELSEHLMIGPAMPVTYLHPARLIRTDVPEGEYSLKPQDVEQPGGADAG
jgi:hypothetical protein